jgi:hypothetical protein
MPVLLILKGVTPMLRTLSVMSLLPILLLAATPASALTAKEKRETCKVGAQAQNLEGKKAADFVKKCMAKGNWEPPGRKVATHKPASKKPAPKPATQQPAPKQ